MQPSIKDLGLTMPQGRAGHRFQDRYVATRRDRRDASWLQRGRRVIRLVLALVAIVIAVFLMFLPGPAVLFYFFAGALLAAESLSIARLMDWAELRVRALWRWGKHHWDGAPRWARVIFVALVVCLSTTSTYLSYRLFAE